MWNPSRFFLLVPLLVPLVFPFLVASGRDAGPAPIALVELPVINDGGASSELSYAPRVNLLAYRLDGLGGRSGLWVMDRGADCHRQVLPDVAESTVVRV